MVRRIPLLIALAWACASASPVMASRTSSAMAVRARTELPAASTTISPKLLEQVQTRVTEPSVPLAAVVEVQPLPQEATPAPAPAAGESDAIPETGGVAAPESVARVDTRALRSRLGNMTLAGAKLFRADQPTLAVSSQMDSLELRQGDVLAIPGTGAPQVLNQPNGGVVASSATVLYLLDQNHAPRELGLVFQSSGLTWQPKVSAFVGTLLVGLVDRENAQAHETLETAIPIQLLSDVGSVDRMQLNISRIGNPYEPVTVSADGSRDPLSIRLVSQVDPSLPVAMLHVEHPLLAISAPEALPGLGIGEAWVTISSLGAPLEPGQAIPLDLDKGWLADSTPVVGDKGIAVTRLRSVGLGGGHLRLAPGRYQASPRTIVYEVPWAFLAAATLGSLGGAFVFAYLLNRNKRKRSTRYRLDGSLGATVGLGSTIMAYAGMRLPEFIPTPETMGGEAAALGLAFITAALATSVIHAFAPAAPEAKS